MAKEQPVSEVRFMAPAKLVGYLTLLQETEANLRNKISRGSFTGAFLVQCMVAMGVTSLRLDD